MVEIITKEIDILPHRSLMPKIGQTGYSVSQAIAELVDNSIDARIDGQILSVVINLDPDESTIQVIDDGIGMDEKTAANSLRLAHSDKRDKLGEFGLGLKTATTSLGKTFRISTTQQGSDEVFILEYDEKKWLESGDWTKHEMKIKKGIDKSKYKSKSGTVVKISGLRFNIYGNLPGNIRKDLATRFAPFIENGEVQIRVNTKWCEPEPLELSADHFPPDGKEPFRFVLESGNEVWGWRGLLKKGSDKGEYGFRVFRRGRLILQNAKLGFNPHPEARQIIGEIHLDHVPVTHNKREFIQESPLYQEVIKEDGIFWKFMRELVRKARSSERNSKIDKNMLEKMAVQKENIMKAIKKIPELKEYAFPDLKERAKGTEENHDGRSEVEIEKRDQGEIVTVVDEPEETDARKRTPKKTHVKRRYYITIQGKRFKVEHSFQDLKTEDVMKDKIVDDIDGIHVFTNIAFPAFSHTRDHLFYGVWHIAEAIAEVMVERNKRNSDEVIKIRDLILKKTAEITRELDELDKETKALERLKKEYEEKVKKIKEIEQSSITV